MSKAYFELTRNEKLVYNSRMVAHWISRRLCDVMLPSMKRKRTTRDGWYNEWKWYVFDCESEWSPIDSLMVCKELGIRVDYFETRHFARYLRDAGYDAREIIGGIIVVANKGESK